MDLPSIDRIEGTARANALAAELDAARGAAGHGNVDEAARSFEKLFATLLVREMSATLKDGFFGDGPGADTFQGWMEEHLGDALSRGRGLGIAEAVRAALQHQSSVTEGDVR